MFWSKKLSSNTVIASPETNPRNHSGNGGRSHQNLLAEARAQVRFEEESDSVFMALANFAGNAILAGVAIVSAFGMATIVLCLYLIVRPFSVSIARRLSAQLGASSWLDALSLIMPNVQIKLTGDSDIPSPVGTSILVSNHMMDGDWFAILMLGRCVGLRGTIKAFLRNEILNLNQPSERSLTRTNSTSSTRMMRSPSHVTVNGSPQRTTTSSGTSNGRHPHPVDLSLAAKFLHTFLEFPLLNGDDYITDRENLFQLLRSFADNDGAAAPVHLLLFPEGWSLYNEENRKDVLARSNEFAKRERRPQLKHLLLPKTTGFNASLDSLRESSPVVYDVTIAGRGYDGSLPPKFDLSIISLWNLLRRDYPQQVHVRIKRYSMEEVLADSSWLDKKWAEKDRLLHHFARHQSFPADRGFARYRVFESRTHSIETSLVSLFRLLLVPCFIPVLLLLSIPIVWTVTWLWIFYSSFKIVFGTDGRPNANTSDGGATPRPDSNPGTPFVPATPFASPMLNW
ncbi:unnamed protein product [Cylindrotheca closterium]|uniref:Acyltransferase C-terminal domain-containing protein n=1 Tax=Cylindrotheca closterium TaxID=2856 RepID=A0AAD2GC81_9STRA|nr:unnamed protein product [Cylindrotheca closterium]